MQEKGQQRSSGSDKYRTVCRCGGRTIGSTPQLMEGSMTRCLRTVSDTVAGFAVRQPRIAVGSAGLGSIMLIELALMLVSHPPV